MIYLISGLALLLLGSAHRFFTTSMLELSLVRGLQGIAKSLASVGLFREFWFFGRTPFALAVLLAFALVEWKAGLASLAVFGITVGLEQLIKGLFNRKRPFLESGQIQMLQPQEPQDPSFPSGDALRIWYLALILGTFLGSSAPFWTGAVLLACLVSLGRLIMGVHYLSDVLAGSGLGLLGAALTIWFWNAYNLL